MKGAAEDGGRLRLLHQGGQDKQLGAAHQEGRIGEITSHPARVFPTWLRVRAEQDALISRGAEARQQSHDHREYGSPLEVHPHFGQQAERRRRGQGEREDRQTPRPHRHGRTGLENPEHVMETQRIAQIEHEQYEVNEQKHESDRIVQ